MPRFFNRIRKQLAKENKFFQYSRYAIGEILLVVIGILIALQVDSWRTTRQTEDLELKILNEIRSNLYSGLSRMNESLAYDSLCIQSGFIILDHLENRLPFHDTLAKHFQRFPNFGFWEIPSSGYDALKSMGLTFLSNDSIRIALSELYETTLPYMADNLKYDVFERRNELYRSELYEHFIMKGSLSIDPENYGRYPNDYPKLLDDARFISMVRSSFDNRLWFITIKEQGKNEIEELLLLINSELKQ